MAERLIRMPDIGEGIAEVEVVAWHVQPGDAVREDQTLAEVMTDTATVEIPSPVAGRILSLHGEVGQTMAVGSDLIRIEVGGSPLADRVNEAQTALITEDVRTTLRGFVTAAGTLELPIRGHLVACTKE